MNPLFATLLHGICFTRKACAGADRGGGARNKRRQALGEQLAFHRAGLRRNLALICPICRARRARLDALREYRPILRAARQ